MVHVSNRLFPTDAPFRRAAGRPSLFNAAASSRAAHYPRSILRRQSPPCASAASPNKRRGVRSLPAPGSRVSPWSRPRPIRDAPDSRHSPPATLVPLAAVLVVLISRSAAAQLHRLIHRPVAPHKSLTKRSFHSALRRPSDRDRGHCRPSPLGQSVPAERSKQSKFIRIPINFRVRCISAETSAAHAD
jgi:hypothetical protein